MSASRLVTDRSMPNIPMERFRESPFDEEEIKIHIGLFLILIHGGYKMIDKIAMITLLILYILATLTALFIYLIIVGANKNKSAEEQKMEDEEQIKYLQNYKKK